MKFIDNKIANYTGCKLVTVEWISIKKIGLNVSILNHTLNFNIHQVKLEIYDI